jgi:hypothetical protein
MEFGTTARRRPFDRLRFDPYDIATLLLLAGLLALVTLTFHAYAVSNDEGVQQHYGELIVRYYASGFTDRTLFSFDNLYLYGGLFDVAATLIAKLLPFDLYSIRHVLSAMTGIGGIAATWATARTIAGPRAGLIAAAMLALCGVWYGGMFNHTKDITFAATMIGASAILLRLARDLPRPRLTNVVFFGLLLGAALGLRALGLLLLLHVAFAVLLAARGQHTGATGDRAVFVGRSLVALSPGFLIGYLLMIAAWPWAALDFFNPVRAIFAFSHFQYPIKTLLAGDVYDMSQVPRWYVPVYFLVKLPLIFLAGLVLALIFAASSRLSRSTLGSRARREIGFIAFMAAFPVLCHVIGHGPAFSGLRHFLFVVPLLAVLAGIGCDALMTRLAGWRPPVALAAAAAIVAPLSWTAVTLTRLHPHEYLFFNELVGGLQGAAGRYDTDYWFNIMPEAMHALENHIARSEHAGRWTPPPFYTIGVCGDKASFEHENALGPRLRTTEDWDNANFFISTTHMNCDRYGTGEVIVKIERLGALIGVIKEGPAIARSGVASADRRADPQLHAIAPRNQ